MTEAEWLQCTDPQRMLADVSTSERKISRLYTACCRQLQQRSTQQRARTERMPSPAEPDGMEDAAFGIDYEPPAFTNFSLFLSGAVWEALRILAADSQERSGVVVLIRDIFGNPFRSVVVNPSWRTPEVADLAHTIYWERSFERLLVLAEALEQAGCTDADILRHCRQPGPHVRGCWVLDLLLGND
jgi:hypothetical protein